MAKKGEALKFAFVSLNPAFILAIAITLVCSGKIHVFAVENAARQVMLSDQEIVALIPRSIDGMDEAELQKYDQSIKMGESLYPVLARELLSTDSEITAGQIVDIFLQGENDKSIPRKAIRELILKKIADQTEDDVWFVVTCGALKKVGTVEDTGVLLQLLEHPGMFVRMNALMALGEIGDQKAAEQIKTWMETREQSPPAPGGRPDLSIREARKAIERIRARMKEPQEIESDSPALATRGTPSGSSSPSTPESSYKPQPTSRWPSHTIGLLSLSACAGLAAWFVVRLVRKPR